MVEVTLETCHMMGIPQSYRKTGTVCADKLNIKIYQNVAVLQYTYMYISTVEDRHLNAVLALLYWSNAATERHF